MGRNAHRFFVKRKPRHSGGVQKRLTGEGKSSKYVIIAFAEERSEYHYLREINIGFLCKEEISVLCSVVLTKFKRDGTQHKEDHPSC